jgi:hypothetical protein
MTDADAVRLLEAAADRIETRGWVQEEYGPPEGPNCCGGALRIERADLPFVPASRRLHGSRRQEVLLRAFEWLSSAIYPDLPRGTQDPELRVVDWNDDVCPDQATAVDMLRRAAKEAANG